MKFYKYLGLGVLAAMSMTSCSDFLEPDNKSTGNADGAAYLAANPTALRATTYNAFSGFVTNIAMHDEGADLYINPRSGGDDGEFCRFTFDPANGSIKSYYSNAYKAINYANAMIQYNGDDSQLADEAKFLRAYGYYLLTQQFGGVPYVTRYIEDAGRDYPRAELADIYDAEIKELEDLYTNSKLPATNHEGTASKQAVAAMLAYYYLCAGWDLDTELVSDVNGTYNVKSTENFAQAAAWAEKAINGVQLTMPFADKWSPYNEGNEEEIFSFQWERDAAYSRGHSLMNDYLAYFGNVKTSGQKGTGSGGTHGPSKKSLKLFDKGDTRWAGTFRKTMYQAKVTKADGQKSAGWGKEGYLANFQCTPEELAKLPIAHIYYPYYVTEAEVEAELTALKSQTKKFDEDEYGVNTPFAAILSDDQVVVYNFNTDGSFTQVIETWEKFFTSRSEGNGTVVTKYDDPNTANVTGGDCYRDVPLFHVSDMYLIAAEAYLLAGQEAQALTKLNAVRKRAGLSNLGSFGAYEASYAIPASFVTTGLDVILDERARELYAERTRYLDLRRTKQLVRYNIAFSRSISDRSQMANAAGEVKWYRPIPDSEISANIAMTIESQNPGY